MNTHADKTQKDKSQSVANLASEKQRTGASAFQFADNRPEAIAQLKLQEMANNSQQAKRSVQLKTIPGNYSAQQQQQPIQKKENNTGLPDNLKSGIENLSGYSMDDVKVHYNSSKPAQLQAHAYAQGTEIHLASGQEKHLPHEAWHVVQQKQSRVKPTAQLRGKININENSGLEKEADVMGAKALSGNSDAILPKLILTHHTNPTAQRLKTAMQEGWVEIPWDDNSGMIEIVIKKIKSKLEKAIEALQTEGMYHFEAGGMKWLLGASDLPVLESLAGESASSVAHHPSASDVAAFITYANISGSLVPVNLKTIADTFDPEKDAAHKPAIHAALRMAAAGRIRTNPKDIRKERQATESEIHEAIHAHEALLTRKQIDKTLVELMIKEAGERSLSGTNHEKVYKLINQLTPLAGGAVSTLANGVDEKLRVLLIEQLGDAKLTKAIPDIVRRGAEHEQIITSKTADLMRRQLAGLLPSVQKEGGKVVTALDTQQKTLVPTNEVVLNTTTNIDGKIYQNHHPTSNDLIARIDGSGERHQTVGSGVGSSGAYHLGHEGGRGLGHATEHNSLSAIQQEILAINRLNLASRKDILDIPADKRGNQIYQSSGHGILHFDDEDELVIIAEYVEIRRARVIDLVLEAGKTVGDETDFMRTPLRGPAPPRGQSPETVNKNIFK